MGILEESKKAKSNGFWFWRNKKFIIIIVLFLLAGGVYAFWPESRKADSRESSAPKEWTVKKDDIKVSVEATGQVVAEDGVELSFNASDGNLKVREVFVSEGDEVKAGDKIATFETSDLELSLDSAWSSYQSALADYNEILAGATDKEIADAQDKIVNAETALEQAKQSLEETKFNNNEKIYDAEKTLENAKEDWENNSEAQTSEDVRASYEDLVDTVKSTDISLDGILRNSDEIIGVDREYLNDDFEVYLGVKEVGSLSRAQGSYIKAADGAARLNDLAVNLRPDSNYSDIDAAAALAQDVLYDFEKHLNDMRGLLNASVTSSELTESELNSFVSSVSSNRTSVNSKITALNDKAGLVEDAIESLDDYEEAYEEAVRDLAEIRIEAESDMFDAEANVKSKEMSLAEVKRDYDDLTAPLTDAEMASARSRLSSASVSLQRARLNLEDATLVSPIDGQVVELNYKTGDIIVDNDRPVAVILNPKTLYISVQAEEADVLKLEKGQKATASFDALDGLGLTGEIDFISLTSQTSNNGIVTYEVRVFINNPGEKQIREGMTADINFISAEVNNVLTVPVSAVRNVDGKPSVHLANGEWTPAITGFTDGKYVEIISGVSEGDIILY